MVSGPILLTGAGGFLGRHVLARAAERDLDLVCASGDLRDGAIARDAVERCGPAAVIHLASGPRGGRPWEVLGDELAMAGALITAVSDVVPGATVVIPGSASQYGLGTSRPLAETDPLAPVSAYGAVKCVLESAATAPALVEQARIIWARTFNILGPGQGADAPVGAWARQLVELEECGGGTLRTGNLDVVRDFLDVRDAADILLDLARSDFAGVVNVGSGEGVHLRDLAQALIAASEIPVAVEPDPALARALDPPYVVADVTRLRALIDRRPRIALPDSLAAVLAQWRAAPATSGGR